MLDGRFHRGQGFVVRQFPLTILTLESLHMSVVPILNNIPGATGFAGYIGISHFRSITVDSRIIFICSHPTSFSCVQLLIWSADRL